MNIINLYEKYFDEETKEILDVFSNYNVYLVGGLVRDILLNKKSNDIDITFEGNAIDLIQKIDCEILSVHKEFGTSKIKIKNKKIDVSSTRSETYPQKGHSPLINKIGVPLKEDILRRDFTVNSLAMSLNKNTFGEIFDYVNGLKNINDKKLKVLHNNSFIDDPSRILRGLKYSYRLDFELEDTTLDLQNKYLSNINYDMSYSRILNEFFRINWDINVFNKFINQKIFKLINPDINTDFDFWFEPNETIVYLGLIMPDERFNLSKKERLIIDTAKNFNHFPKNNIEIYNLFSKYPSEVAQILSILKNDFAKIYLKKLKDIKINISGKDLLNLGFSPSKKIKEILDFILEKKLENSKLSKNDEINLIKTYFLNEG